MHSLCLSFAIENPLSVHCPYASVSPLGTPSLHTVPMPQFPYWGPPLHALPLWLRFLIWDPLSVHCPRSSVSPLATPFPYSFYASVSTSGTPSPCTVPVPQFPHRAPWCQQGYGAMCSSPPFPSPPPIVPGSAGVPAPVTLMGCDTAGGAGCPLGGAPPVSCPQGNRGGIFDRPGNELLNLL